MQQLPLAISPRPEPAFDNFVPGPNAEALARVRELAAGTLLSLYLHSSRTGRDRTLLASVARVHPQEDGKWLLGCNFIRELLDDELQAFV